MYFLPRMWQETENDKVWQMILQWALLFSLTLIFHPSLEVREIEVSEKEAHNYIVSLYHTWFSSKVLFKTVILHFSVSRFKAPWCNQRLGVPTHMATVTYIPFTAAGIKLSIEPDSSLSWSLIGFLICSGSALCCNLEHAVRCCLPPCGVKRKESGSRLEPGYLRLWSKSKEVLTVGQECVAVCAWTCRGSSFNIHNCCHAYISPWLTAGVHWHHSLAPEMWTEKKLSSHPAAKCDEVFTFEVWSGTRICS